MTRRLTVIFVLALCLLPTSVMVAQQPPPPPAVEQALALLNEELGTSLTLDSPELVWSWREETFPDAALGCPQPDQMYAQVLTQGYVITFTFQGTVYDFRAAREGDTVFLCETRPAPTEEAVAPEPTAAPITEPTPPPAIPEGPAITVETAPEVVLLFDVEGQFVNPLEWVPGGTIVLAALPGVEVAPTGTLLYLDAQAPDAEPVMVETGQTITAMDSFTSDAVSYVVTGGLQGQIDILPVVPQPLDIMRMQTAEDGPMVNAVAITPDGTIIASASGAPSELGGVTERVLRLWNAVTGELIREVETQSPVGAVGFSPDGQTLAFGMADGTIGLLDMANLEGAFEPVYLPGHLDLVRDVAFSPDGRWLASGAMDGTAHIWDLTADPLGPSTAVLDAPGAEAVLAVAFSPDGRILAAAGGDPNVGNAANAIYLWEPFTVDLLGMLVGHTGAVGDIAFSPDGTQLASVGDDRHLLIWGLPGTIQPTG